MVNTLPPQAQVDEFEKRLTAVHTRGLENVESPEMDEENQKEGGSAEKTVTRTPLPTRGRPRAKRGQFSQDFTFAGPAACKCSCRKTFHFVLVAGQAKPSVSGRGDESFVTPQRTRKSKKPVITFSSDEEEDEEGECSHFIKSTFDLT